jgi:hypothetical protein
MPRAVSRESTQKSQWIEMHNTWVLINMRGERVYGLKE